VGGLVLAGILLWALFTAVAIYHWLRYSHAALLSIPSIVAHLFVSGVLIVFTLDALASFSS
jgi:ABC-type phosphate transport system permease subunit